MPHIAWTFHFIELPAGVRRRFMRRALSRVDHFVVASNMERELYASELGLREQRFDFLRWGAKPPVVDIEDPGVMDGPYIFSGGAEGRDYSTFIEAMRKLPRIPALIIARPRNLQGLSPPANVTVLMDVGLERFNRLMADSRFCVLPLAHELIPCGHSTMVAFMHLGKAQVVTNSSGVRDYVREDDNGLLVPPGDPDAMAERIEALWNDETSCARMGAA
ncbi:MAG: glycosyltransferase family 4 protein, partial [Proteobacteria bacterium]|nr:glycosyltransferase family 4 protein [Pseudomonadota bacterium]